ncbi:OPT family oligopeptide transporter [Algibacillus agarilyticus]|uniref:OPT family oligopeptide transporter n=1 Tax=Algibacillus agarilyticus TaxID=2234133 RepID=UPI000DCFA173|nr:oligopeptide transporter, OPT family [Algibacillus agarilyticus]
MTNKNNNLHPPLIGPEQTLAEITIKSITLAIILAMLLAAANAYIGLLVGLTISASIPAAALSMGILRLFKNSNVLENNLVQTSASAGESLVAGIIFTIPALVMMQAWQGYDYWPLVQIAIVGGILGVVFTIPLRRALIIDAKLTFPEGVATSEVLKTGTALEQSLSDNQTRLQSNGLRHLLQASGIGALFKLAESGFGMLSGWIANIQTVASQFILSTNLAISPALIGVGYIVGFNVAILVFVGGIIGTLVGVPLNWWLNADNLLQLNSLESTLTLADLNHSQLEAIANTAWDQNRRIGVGAMIVGGIWSLICLIKPLAAGIKASINAYKASLNKSNHQPLRTEYDTPINYVLIVSLLSLVPLFFIFESVLHQHPQALWLSGLMTVFMFILGFLFSSVAGYMAGLVGSSNNPISGVTIATVIISALILLQLIGNDGIAGQLGPIVVIYLAALICSSAAIAGDNMQDLKCGHILGATPWRQQLFQIIGVVSAALVIPIILQILDTGYGIGRPAQTGSTQFLSAPQASLMKELATGIFGAGINWLFIYIGMGLAAFLIIIDQLLRIKDSSFRIPILAVAVGIYLPVGLSIPIFIGGVIAALIHYKSKSAASDKQQAIKNTGLLLASGLITGEALMGVVIAIAAAFFMELPAVVPYGNITGLTAFTLVIIYMYKRIRNT